MASAKNIRLLLAEDHPLTGHHLHTFLSSFRNIDVVGRAQNGPEAVLLAEQLQPTVVVMDVNLPKMNGIAATREIRTRYPQIAVVGLSFRIEEYIVYAMLKAGAFQVVAKEQVFTDLYNTIQQAVAAIYPIFILGEPGVSRNTTVRLDDSNELSSPASKINSNTENNV